MNRALGWLLLLSLRGRVVRAARLLRQPKYGAGLAVGLVYFGWLFTRAGGGEIRLGGFEVLHSDFDSEGIHLLAAALTAVVIGLAWILAGKGKPLAFSQAEIHQLFSAPISRGSLIRFSLLKSQAGILFAAGLIAFLGGFRTPPAFVQQAGAFWLMLNLWDLNAKARHLWRADTARRSAAGRAVLNLAVPVVVLVYVGAVLSGLVPLVRDAVTGIRHAEAIDVNLIVTQWNAAVEQSWLRAPLAPFLWVLAPLFAYGETFPWRAWLPAMAVLGAHYAWVVRSQARFEENSLAAERQRQEKASRRSLPGAGSNARRRVPYPLHAEGRPEGAVYWKNLILAGRVSAKMVGLTLVAAPLVLAAAVFLTGAPRNLTLSLTVLCVVLTVAAPFFLAAFWSKGLVSDFKHIELIRPWPVAGWRLMAAEVLAPATLAMLPAGLGVAGLFAVDTASRLAGNPAGGYLVPPELAAQLGASPTWILAAAGAAAVPVVGAFAFLSAGMQTTAALLLPGWVLTFKRSEGSVAGSGQGILVGMLYLIVLSIALVPELFLVGLLALVHGVLGVPFTLFELPLVGLAVATPLLLEGFALVRWSGRMWDRLDPSRELLES